MQVIFIHVRINTVMSLTTPPPPKKRKRKEKKNKKGQKSWRKDRKEQRQEKRRTKPRGSVITYARGPSAPSSPTPKKRKSAVLFFSLPPLTLSSADNEENDNHSQSGKRGERDQTNQHAFFYELVFSLPASRSPGRERICHFSEVALRPLMSACLSDSADGWHSRAIKAGRGSFY